MINEKIIKRYETHLDDLKGLKHELAFKFAMLIDEQAIKIHRLSSRLKSKESLKAKLSRPDKIYHSIDDITDILGFRIITYFEDSIDEIARVVEENFEVDFANSIDKRKFLDSSKFGYRSLHYICYLPNDLGGFEFEENRFKFEVQIRTILQHAWAEIEHDLGYKAQESIPRHIRRKFTRIASLLEIADEEFVGIRSFFQKYETEVNESIQKGESQLHVDKISLVQFIKTPQVRALDERISTILKIPVDENAFFPNYLAKMLRHVGFRWIKFNRHSIPASTASSVWCSRTLILLRKFGSLLEVILRNVIEVIACFF